MAHMTVDDVRRILVECAGVDDSIDITGDISDRPFDELGYDSLALMESAAQIKQEFGVVVPDDELVEVETPRALIDLVNGLVTEAAAA
ncbi:acyl carrier protein [Streptomyces sp. KLMMK]|uniref:Acyl carrier protein n=2 Tax=Streptomyces TaxID=1883 RepID=A0A9X2LP25_9ACTN|nr:MULTISPECIES: acyl carrier protein [Streptomyces]MCQ8774738.1 acyl carrier protein [Streptomyces telluris]NJP78179.1 acyl carrier protein [Streptomyces telluris]QBK46635.1 HrsL [Streptomyces hiroshimensis]QLE72943.1 acyl carrier protein [Streptomyces rectiverticillatus]